MEHTIILGYMDPDGDVLTLSTRSDAPILFIGARDTSGGHAAAVGIIDPKIALHIAAEIKGWAQRVIAVAN